MFGTNVYSIFSGAVKLPVGEDINEWMAANSEFFAACGHIIPIIDLFSQLLTFSTK